MVIAVFASGCGPDNTSKRAEADFDRNVESCICRYMQIEENNYSGLTYEYFVEDCNETVMQSNPTRYPDSFLFEPEITELRCQEDVEPWEREVEEWEGLRENNQRFFEEFGGDEEPSENEPGSPANEGL